MTDRLRTQRAARVEVGNDELVSVRDAMRGLNRMVDQLASGEAEKFVLMKKGRMAAVVIPIGAHAQADVPVMALRPHNMPDWPGLDDVVVEHPTMYRAEFMDDNNLWMCCYFGDDHDRITFSVHWDKKLKRLVLFEGEMPAEWIDWDEQRKAIAHDQ